MVGPGRHERAPEPVGESRGSPPPEAPGKALILLGVVLDATPATVIEYRAEVPGPAAFVRLFSTTGWVPQGRLTVEAAAEALAPTWYAVSAYAGERLVGIGRIIGDGVL